MLYRDLLECMQRVCLVSASVWSTIRVYSKGTSNERDNKSKKRMCDT